MCDCSGISNLFDYSNLNKFAIDICNVCNAIYPFNWGIVTHTIQCCYNPEQKGRIRHPTLQWLRQNNNQGWHSQNTHHISTSRASYGVFIVTISKKIDNVITAPWCHLLLSMVSSSLNTNTSWQWNMKAANFSYAYMHCPTSMSGWVINLKFCKDVRKSHPLHVKYSSALARHHSTDGSGYWTQTGLINQGPEPSAL